MAKPNPHYLLIDLFQGEHRDYDRALKDKPVKHPTLIRIDEPKEKAIEAIVTAIGDHVKARGKVREIVFSGHGGPREDGEPSRMGSVYLDGWEGELDEKFSPDKMRDALSSLTDIVYSKIIGHNLPNGRSVTDTLKALTDLNGELNPKKSGARISANVMLHSVYVLQKELKNIPDSLIGEALSLLQSELKAHVKNGYYSNEITVVHMLEALDKLQETLGTEIADRIAFTGCSLMVDPLDPLVRQYQNYAIKHKTALALSTTDTEPGSTASEQGRFVEIMPSGDFHRDRLDPSVRHVSNFQKDLWDPHLTSEHHIIKAHELPRKTLETTSSVLHGRTNDLSGNQHESLIG